MLAIGDRQPAWVGDAFDSYAGRLPREWRFKTQSIPTAKRSRNQPASRAIDAEGQKLLANIGASEQLVLLDERGKQTTSRRLGNQLSTWLADGRDLVFVIGGPDGVSDDVRRRADITWSLSQLTLPHGLARVLLVEQLYRASSLLAGHPYHRE
ncbi:MAG: 23S rRNA (pseudouridine(1915)-N(3))-methyltransferase RlmH [Woeseiaceae bacterium]|nr:23S rRNA (pseudouridine(1915)-N(3))-methyltransferase RlmH [Woeseiaceae bacterium]